MAARAVIFDLDDTLVDTQASFIIALQAVADRYLPGQRGEDLVGPWRADVNGHYRAYTRGELSYDQQRARRADELMRAHGGSGISEAEYPAWAQTFDTAWEGAWVLHPDAAACLELLRAAGVRVGLITNADRELQERKLDAVGLADLKEVLVTVDTLGVGKPAPEVFHHACALLGVEPGVAVYVGDEFDTDALGANAAGLRGVWIDRPGLGHTDALRATAAGQGVERITGLAELSGLLGLGELTLR